jgi:hypothetical protein
MSAVKEIRAAGFKISEVYTPFPVHGLDKAMGLKETRIAMAAFMYGLLGLTVAVTLTWYMKHRRQAQPQLGHEHAGVCAHFV